jgi:hypothetical protein
MAWVIFWSALAMVFLTGVAASASSVRFQQRVANEGRLLLVHARSRRSRGRADLHGLPAPVARYVALAIDPARPAIHTVRLRHGGTFRMKPNQRWFPIRGKQFFSADPPGFVWWGRIRMVPGVWIDARDKLVDGSANMRILAESLVVLGDSSGSEIDESSAVRLLAEMLWFPTTLLDERFVSWSPIDDESARATLRVRGREVNAVFHFGPDGLPARISARRYRDVGGGRSVLTPWSGVARDYRKVSGLTVPFEVDAIWELESGPFRCLSFVVEEIEYDPIEAQAVGSIGLRAGERVVDSELASRGGRVVP